MMHGHLDEKRFFGHPNPPTSAVTGWKRTIRILGFTSIGWGATPEAKIQHHRRND